MKQTDQKTPSGLRCKNCGGSYDPSLPNCPYCGEETSVNTAASSAGLMDEARAGGGFGEGSLLHRVSNILLVLLLVAFLGGGVWLGVDTARSLPSTEGQQTSQQEEPSNGTEGDTSGGDSSVSDNPGETENPGASVQTDPEQENPSEQETPAEQEEPADPDEQETPEQDPDEQEEPEEPDLSIATALSLSDSSLSLEAGGSAQLTASVEPDGWTGSVIWSSSDQSVAMVDSTGRVTWVAGGSCTITAEAGDLSESCSVTCAEAEEESDLELYYTYLGERYTDITLNNVGDGFALEVSGGTGTYQWSTSNAAVATVTDGGSVYATGSGRCTITVTSGGASASVIVIVR